MALAKLHKHFPALPKDEEVLEDCSCAYAESAHGVPQQGHLWVTNNYLCFHAKILSRKTQIQLKLEDIKMLEKQNTAYLVPNAMLIHTKDNKRYFFTSLMRRDQTYDAIQRQLYNHGAPEEASTTPAVLAAEASTPAHQPEPVLPATVEKEAEKRATVTEKEVVEEKEQREEDAKAVMEAARLEAEEKTRAEEQQRRKEEERREAEEARKQEERKRRMDAEAAEEERKRWEREKEEEEKRRRQVAAEEEAKREQAEAEKAEKREREREERERVRKQEQEEKLKKEASGRTSSTKAEKLAAAVVDATKKPTEAGRAKTERVTKASSHHEGPLDEVLHKYQTLLVLFALLLTFVLWSML